MTTKFTKGGILNSSQLEDISGKKWKKGGILSATQLNKLSDESGASSEPIHGYVRAFTAASNKKLVIQPTDDVIFANDNVQIELAVAELISLNNTALSGFNSIVQQNYCIVPRSGSSTVAELVTPYYMVELNKIEYNHRPGEFFIEATISDNDFTFSNIYWNVYYVIERG